ncbi:hypothetical protein [Lysobacter gummosus]|uniref:hypothetical protein n=1 Tax=Lysobacter gummosus TaxID=262324 RepID=UPI003628E251
MPTTGIVLAAALCLSAGPTCAQALDACIDLDRSSQIARGYDSVLLKHGEDRYRLRLQDGCSSDLRASPTLPSNAKIDCAQAARTSAPDAAIARSPASKPSMPKPSNVIGAIDETVSRMHRLRTTDARRHRTV